MDNAQNCDSYTNIPSPQTYSSYLLQSNIPSHSLCRTHQSWKVMLVSFLDLHGRILGFLGQPFCNCSILFIFSYSQINSVVYPVITKQPPKLRLNNQVVGNNFSTVGVYFKCIRLCILLNDSLWEITERNFSWRMPSSGMWHCLGLVRTDVSKERRFPQGPHTAPLPRRRHSS
jgi:hypothetical protein